MIFVLKDNIWKAITVLDVVTKIIELYIFVYFENNYVFDIAIDYLM